MNVDYSDDKELVQQYLEWTGQAVSQMREIVDRLNASDDGKTQLVQDVYGLAHNIKGMGASFNFPLMTEGGLSLCGYINGLDTENSASHKVLHAHTRLFEVVLENNIKGPVEEKGQILLSRLQELIEQEDA